MAKYCVIVSSWISLRSNQSTISQVPLKSEIHVGRGSGSMNGHEQNAEDDNMFHVSVVSGVSIAI